MEGVFMMVVLIVLISTSAGVATRYIKLRQQQLGTQEDGGVREELEEVRQRVEVLEKIVTDRKFRLSDEIADLERG
ncbi:MAG: hypothetical protein OXE40_13975 [Gammaproteobacteria bacterium]|nr:hypothetical protein [Gammaproteobacteria bacterium]